MHKISIELENATRERLLQLAESNGKSVETMAAELLAERVENTELNRLRMEIRRLRHDLSLSTQVLLATSNGVNEDDARNWVKENLRDC